MIRFYIKTYGCQMNERESEALACLLDSLGYTETFREEEADVIILNTCSVREQAERKAIGKAGLLKRLLCDKPNLVIGIIGCMAQNRGQSLFELIPHLSFVAGTEQLHQVPEMIKKALAGKRRLAELGQGEPVYHECPGHKPGGVCAMTSVMRGCNQFCTYCIVPYTRGRERSREIPAIVDEITMLAERGTKEILLLGQNITAYGLVEARENGTYTPEISPFAELLEAVNGIPGIERIRFTSPHVRFMNDRFIDAICSLPKVCKSFHIPLQSGSDRMLRLMHRGYTAEAFLKRVDSIKSKLPEVAFSTDVIVGFSSETQEDFEATRALMKAVGFKNGSVIGQHTLRFVVAAVIAAVLASVIVLPLSKGLLTFIFAQIGSVSSTGIAFDAVEIFGVCPAILLGMTVIGTLLTALYTKTIKASDTASIE